MLTSRSLGHETTSGLLSFLFVQLLKNPSCYQKAQKEVDDVIGKEPVTLQHMSRLPYITACLRETLRLNPSAPAFTVRLKGDKPTVMGGRYEIKPGQTIKCLLPKIHRDPSVFGEDAEIFKPERMLDENFQALPKNAWKASSCPLPSYNIGALSN